MTRVLLDTDIIIDHLRGYKPATDFLFDRKSPTCLVSTMTVAELYAGIRDHAQESTVETLLAFFQVIPIDHQIALAGGSICKAYKNSHGTSIQDAIIAATAEQHHAVLATLNTKHFPMVKTIKPYHKK